MIATFETSPAFFYDNSLVDDFTITASHTDASYSADYIQNARITQSWKSSVGATKWIEGNVVGAPSIKPSADFGVVWCAYENPLAFNYRIQLWNATPALIWDATFSNNVAATDITAYYIRAMYAGVTPASTAVALDTSQTISRWRITTTSAGIIDCGRLIIGNPFHPADGYGPNAIRFRSDQSASKSESEGGQIFADTRPKKRIVSAAPPKVITNEDFPEYSDMLFGVGSRMPIIMDGYPVMSGTDIVDVSVPESEYYINTLYRIYGYCSPGTTFGRHLSDKMSVSGDIVFEEAL